MARVTCRLGEAICRLAPVRERRRVASGQTRVCCRRRRGASRSEATATDVCGGRLAQSCGAHTRSEGRIADQGRRWRHRGVSLETGFAWQGSGNGRTTPLDFPLCPTRANVVRGRRRAAPGPDGWTALSTRRDLLPRLSAGRPRTPRKYAVDGPGPRHPSCSSSASRRRPPRRADPSSLTPSPPGTSTSTCSTSSAAPTPPLAVSRTCARPSARSRSPRSRPTPSAPISASGGRRGPRPPPSTARRRHSVACCGSASKPAS